MTRVERRIKENPAMEFNPASECKGFMYRLCAVWIKDRDPAVDITAAAAASRQSFLFL
jgi:hypothetical protein